MLIDCISLLCCGAGTDRLKLTHAHVIHVDFGLPLCYSSEFYAMMFMIGWFWLSYVLIGSFRPAKKVPSTAGMASV